MATVQDPAGPEPVYVTPSTAAEPPLQHPAPAYTADHARLPPTHDHAHDNDIENFDARAAHPAAHEAAPSPSPAPLPLRPPPLPYDLREHKRSLGIFWSLILVDCIAVPLALYFGLWYGTDLSHNAVFSISTACLGGVSIFEYFIRFWRLFRAGSDCRPIGGGTRFRMGRLGGKRAWLDWFQITFTIMWFIIAVELIVGTIPSEPLIRLLAMPVPSLMFWFGLVLLALDGLRVAGVPSPFRISSVAKGQPLRPGIYSLIEDVVAVDGGGKTEYRVALNQRYEQSHYFRQMLHRLTLFWGGAAVIGATVLTAIVFTCERNTAYIIGWVVPFGWAGIWAVITVKWVQHDLRFEEAEWAKAAKAGTATPAAPV